LAGPGAGDQALRELPSPGKSGSVFFVSHDDKYMIKTMRKVGALAHIIHTLHG
jgi:hypothetical protein